MAHFPSLPNGVSKIPGGSAVHAFAVTPHDTNALAYPTTGIYVGGTGSLTVTMKSGVEATFTAIPTGTLLPIEVSNVKSTGTTATNIVALV